MTEKNLYRLSNLIRVSALLCFILSVLFAAYALLTGESYNGNPAAVTGVLFAACSLLSSIMEIYGAYLKRQPAPLIEIFSLTIWTALIAFILGMRFAANL